MLFAAIAWCSAIAHAQHIGKVLSSTPAIHEVLLPQQICSSEQPVMTKPTTSGAGAFLGSVAGGAAGNALGGGNGQGWLTLFGAVAGALLGDRAESRPSEIQHVRNCTLQSVLETRVIGYDVRYEYAGRQYSARLPQDPGPTISVQILPVSNLPAPRPGADALGEGLQQLPEPVPRIGGEDFSSY